MNENKSLEMKVSEMEGFANMGMHRDALALVKEVLSDEQINDPAFGVAVWAILVGADDCKPWESLVRTAYARLPESDQQELKAAMLSYYTTIKDMETAVKFIAYDTNSPIFLVQSMWALLETKRLDEAKVIFERCRELVDFTDGCDLSYLLTAMADYCQQTGRLEEAEQYWLRSSEMNEPLLQNALEGLVKIQAARAHDHARLGLGQVEKFKTKIDPETAVMLPGNHDELLAEARKTLEAHREALAKIVPEKDLWRFGQK